MHSNMVCICRVFTFWLNVSVEKKFGLMFWCAGPSLTLALPSIRLAPPSFVLAMPTDGSIKFCVRFYFVK